MKWYQMRRMRTSFFIMAFFMPASLSGTYMYVCAHYYFVILVFIIPPGTYVSFLGAANTTFKCTSHGETLRGVQWYLNGSHLENFNLTQVRHTFVRRNFNYGLLVFSNMTQDFNETRVSCSAVVASGQTERSHDVLLLIQGTYVCEYHAATPRMQRHFFLSSANTRWCI